ncbi:MAG: arsenosugar biosynthesis radical SAM protein ArsS [Leptospiraceae bacterium]|nr:arsenosugar biosynthesis radical SAM protein ArsS [Leptospiraceae bacterium]
MQAAEQLQILATVEADFQTAVLNADSQGLRPVTLATFQINLGKICNQACRHCHVAAGPNRTESMSRPIIDRCLEIIRSVPDIQIVDITGGAPELHPDFRYLVQAASEAGKQVMNRCNLTIIEEDGFDWLPDFLAANKVAVIASLPHFAAARTDQQRGRGVFDKSVQGMQKLNAVGYGDRLPLHLVYNPTGLFLAASQQDLEREYKQQLSRRHDLRFNQLFCINNMPISRYLESLLRAGKFEQWMTVLVNGFNPATIPGLMCRHQISVGYDGRVYDCDFNQMLELQAEIAHVDHFDYQQFMARTIKVANHCYGCTAGAGSSCGGELA